MAITFIPTSGRQDTNTVASQIIGTVRSGAVYPANTDVVLYAGWPQVKDYSGRTHISDLTVFGSNYGIKLIKICLSAKITDVRRDAQSILQASATTESLMGKSLNLKRRRKLIFEIVPIVYAPNINKLEFESDEVELAQNEADLIALLKVSEVQLTDDQQIEVQAILEGAKALGQLAESDVDEEIPPLARAYRDLEAIIYNFDASQRSIALTSIRGPQRIRGLAGTGKTVILAMKAALAHIANPNSKILVTYYTRSLRDIIERLITRFHRHFAEVDPNWENVHVRHGWGRSNTPGVYRDVCIREGFVFKSYGDVRNQDNPFGFVCRELVDSDAISQFYDIILIDEGQDFPDSFYQMCFFLAKGHRD